MPDELNAAVSSTPSNDAEEPSNADPNAAPAANPAPAGDPATGESPETGKSEPQVPEAYEFAMPDGIELDKDAAAEFSAIAKGLKLTQEQAQQFADIAVKMQQRQTEAHVRTVESWVEQVKADKEIGGDKLNDSLKVAKQALDAFGTPELKDILDATGLGNHPAVIRAFYNIGKKISSDSQVITGSPAGETVDVAKKLFPNMN